MSTTMSTNSFGFASPKSSATCNICTRLLYSFEEILVCRICHGSFHWRCVRPETISHYGENTQFICEKCHEHMNTNVTSTHRLSNGGIRIKSPDSSETDYRQFVGIPSKFNGTSTKDTTVINTVRYFEDKQQHTSTIPNISKSNGHHNGQYTDDNKAIRRITQQQQPPPPTNFDSDEENNTTGMFQADYQYTPLKEYAAMRNSETNINGYQTSPLIQSTNHHFTSPTIDNITVHNHQEEHSIPSNDRTFRRQQIHRSTPYLSSQIPDNSSSTLKSSIQHTHVDHHSTVGSDSGIVLNNPSTNIDGNPLIERKLTDLVHQLGKQLETDAQKLSEKLELKLKNLEHMIHQQTYIIRRQDEVIERLKSKILKIENERDHFRERLSVHEQREHDEINKDETHRKIFEHDDLQPTSNDISTIRKFSTSSSATTERSRRSSKKTPAPRIDQQGSLIKNETESTIAKFIATVPTNQEQPNKNSPALSATGRLIATVPVVEKPAAASRLDDIIHQSNTNQESYPSQYYNITDGRQYDPKTNVDPVRRSRSSSSSSSSSATSTSSAGPAKPSLTTTNNSGLPPRNLNRHQSLESIPRRTSQTERTLDPTNKTTSLEFGQRPGKFEDPGSIYITPQEALHPASQYQDAAKGWIRKQNRDSLFKRVERYYCVISNNVLLMHKNMEDTRPQKAINLRGAKVVKYEDPKRGPALELTWSRRNKELKRYHLFDLTEQETQQWLTSIQTAIDNLNNRNLPSKDLPEANWQRYRMQS